MIYILYLYKYILIYTYIIKTFKIILKGSLFLNILACS